MKICGWQAAGGVEGGEWGEKADRAEEGMRRALEGLGVQGRVGRVMVPFWCIAHNV